MSFTTRLTFMPGQYTFYMDAEIPMSLSPKFQSFVAKNMSQFSKYNDFAEKMGRMKAKFLSEVSATKVFDPGEVACADSAWYKWYSMYPLGIVNPGGLNKHM